MLPVYSAFTNDLIAEYAFGINCDWLGNPEFNKDFFPVVSLPKLGSSLDRWALTSGLDHYIP